jgi:four helix bundle protein
MGKEMENRLIEFSIDLKKTCADLKFDFLSQHLACQVLRSGTSAALNYGESQAAESKKDFIHKNSIVLKELRETLVNLKIIYGSELHTDAEKMNYLIDECNQLVSIFYKIVQTARRNNLSK